MKKIISLLFVLFVAIGTYSQSIDIPSSSTFYEFSTKVGSINYSYYDYTGSATDLLISGTSDTIAIQYLVKKYKPYTLKTISKFNPILGADTTVIIQIFGKNSTDESWTAITNTLSAVVTTDGVVKSLNSATSPTYAATIAAFDAPFTNPTAGTADTLEVPQQTISLTETSTLLEYRYILVMYIISGDDSVGTGVELVRSELKLFEH